MTRYCANCGTEVDESAIFCPTCGQPIEQDTETEMPAAPAWPEPEPRAAAAPSPGPRSEPLPEPEPEPLPVPEPPAAAPMSAPAEESPRWQGDDSADVAAPSAGPAIAASRSYRDEPARDAPPVERPAARTEAQPVSPAPPPSAPPPGASGTERPSGRASGPAASVPFTAPVTLSAWLIGVGAALGALGAIIGLFDSTGAAIDLLAFVALLGVAITVFFTTALPAIPHLRFITLVVVLVTFGIGLDRLGAGGAGAGDLLLFLGAAAAMIGAVLLELGHDQPLGGPQT